MDRKELINLVNKLSNDNIKDILNIKLNDIAVYLGSYKHHSIGGDVESVCMNGAIIQINVKERPFGCCPAMTLEEYIYDIDNKDRT